MAEILYNTIPGSINIMPITGLRICKHPTIAGGLEEEIIYFHHLESESSYTITPKTRVDKHGGERTLGHYVEITAYVPHNDYRNTGIISNLESLRNIHSQSALWRNWHLIVMIGAGFMGAPTPTYRNVTPDKGFWVELSKPQITYEIESVEMRPRLILRTKQFVRNISSIIIT